VCCQWRAATADRCRRHLPGRRRAGITIWFGKW
jgi:hypothetical protein